ncbi:hypothetical protein PVAP13_5NG021700 [Panicum virgatum]|uniref:Uncharacterized protein n=1 Tax=Panicum virgatum TaxID=38727 RepID=A0A8T0RJ52_PANVG|nr:hypothetical protein PVAP13_5NG023808 [Panicum virgatum]KAG2586101.1 hypothetical protein PVAP13_5NG023808 [Panicum virgatum]KAG2586105.1 hypothetical protein PVAP13_5NG021700 [Panicum virgatum]KAG2586106.1 hypothetical protein PVAP13_5NG021700 [Panicum virgatum]
MDALLRPERAIELLLTKKRQGLPLHRLPVPAPSSSNAAGLHHIALSPSSLRRWRCPALALGSRPALPCLMGRTRIQSTVDVPSTTNLGSTCSIQRPEGAQGWSVFGVPSAPGCRKDALAPLHAVTRRRAPVSRSCWTVLTPATSIPARRTGADERQQERTSTRGHMQSTGSSTTGHCTAVSALPRRLPNPGCSFYFAMQGTHANS